MDFFSLPHSRYLYWVSAREKIGGKNIEINKKKKKKQRTYSISINSLGFIIGAGSIFPDEYAFVIFLNDLFDEISRNVFIQNYFLEIFRVLGRLLIELPVMSLNQLFVHKNDLLVKKRQILIIFFLGRFCIEPGISVEILLPASCVHTNQPIFGGGSR